jgi:uncharacterized membrane protein YcgQ (UPF0703/DUF1980 family)
MNDNINMDRSCLFSEQDKYKKSLKIPKVIKIRKSKKDRQHRHKLNKLMKSSPIYNKLHHYIRVITKLPNSEQSYKGKVKTHKYINRQNQSTTGKL